MSLPTCPQNRPLKDVDPEMQKLLEEERARQEGGLELIASENFTSTAVQEALGSCATNKYAEGIPGKRYYGGNEVIDQIERLAQTRALKTFRLNEAQWGCNVQPYSGSVANMAAQMAVLQPGDTLMGLNLASGGHLTHGHQSATKKISASAIFYTSVQYGLDDNGLLDYEAIAKIAEEAKPKLIICGASAYPRDWDYRKFREISDKVGATLMCDMAHIAGLVAAEEANDPFRFCQLVTTTTHKSLRGPRAGVIFYRKGPIRDIEEKEGEEAYTLEAAVNFSVFPSLQGGPHEHQIAAIGVAMLEAQDASFKVYAQQVKANSAALASALEELGHTIVTGGSDNHLVLWNIRAHDLTGSKVEKACDVAGITVNKNMIVGDKSAMAPGGVRLGTPALTSRGMKEADMKTIAGFLDRAQKVALKLQNEHGRKLVDFNKFVGDDEELKQLEKEVKEFSRNYPLPGKVL